MKKLLHTIITVILAAGLLVGCGGSPSAAEAPSETTIEQVSGGADKAAAESSAENAVSLNVAYMPNYGSLWSIENAIAQGYLAEEGITVNLVEFPDGPSIIEAMEAGDIDIGYIGQGAHRLVIGGRAVILALSHISNGDALIAREGIGSIEELAGKKVAYTSDSSSENILMNSLKLVNLSMEDIEAVNMPVEEVAEAMTSGEVDACATWSPYSMQIMEAMPEATKLADNLHFIDETVALSSWITTPEFAAEHKEEAVGFVRALFKAMDYAAINNQKETAAMIAERVNQDGAGVYNQRGDAVWMTGKEVAKGAADGTVQRYYENQRGNLLNVNEIENPLTVEEYLMLDIMVEAGAY